MYQSEPMIDPFTPRYDAIVIGSGAGGSTLAYELSRRGHRVLVVERGNFLKPQRLNPSDPIGKYIYRMIRNLDDSYFVGGHTKFYGSALYRMRESDFHAVEHEKGVSPAWPITYSELEPYYEKAEVLYRVHGATLGDPTEPPRARPFPYPPIEHAPLVSGLVRRIEQSGTRYRRFHSAWITGRAALVFSVRPVMDTIARLTRRWMPRLQHCVRRSQPETSDY